MMKSLQQERIQNTRIDIIVNRT